MTSRTPPEPRHERTQATPADPPARILLVDDDHIILDALGEFLRLEGYEVTVSRGHRRRPARPFRPSGSTW